MNAKAGKWVMALGSAFLLIMAIYFTVDWIDDEPYVVLVLWIIVIWGMISVWSPKCRC